MNVTPLRQVLLVAVAAPLLAACTGSLPATSVIVTQPPAATAAATSPTATVTSSGPTSTITSVVRSTVTVSPDVRVADSTSVFVSPSGRIACMMVSPSEGGSPTQFWVRCDYLDSDRAWTVARPENCQFHWGDTLFLLDTAKAGCVIEAGYAGAIMYPMNQGSQTWWHDGDPTVHKYGATLAALPYGSSLQVGWARCSMETAGVTCTNSRTGHGIIVSQSTYGMF